MDDIEELEKDYYELARSPILSGFEVVNEKPKVEKVKFDDLAKRKDFNPIDVRERVNWMERRLDEFEKTLTLVNRNFDDYRQTVNERLDRHGKTSPEFKSEFDDFKRIVSERLEKLENHERIPEEVRDELSSLKSLVGKVSVVNKEIKAKIPQMLRELESRVSNFTSRIGVFDEELKKIKEEVKKDYWNRPVILE